MLSSSFFVVVGSAAAAVLGGWAYFGRYEISRPPIGVFGLGDVAFMVGAIFVLPYLYLAFPIWVVGGIFALGMLSVLYFAAEPVLRARWAVWIVALAAWGADIWIHQWLGAFSPQFLAINNAVLVVAIASTTNLWVQSGMKARDVTVLAGVLVVYDVVATSLLPLTNDLFTRLTGMPFAPLVAWGTDGALLSIGIGDLLFATAFPLVMRKAFGRSAGIAAMIIALGTIAAMLAFLLLAKAKITLPVMAALGPLIVAQYVFWRLKRGQERTTWQYLLAEQSDRRRTATPATEPEKVGEKPTM